jgi:hypothetical protein
MPPPYDPPITVFAPKTNKVDLVNAGDINELQDEVVAINNRLGNTIDDDGSIKSGTSFPGSPLNSQMFWRTDLAVLYVYNGTSWQAISQGGGIPTHMQIFTSSGTWTRPPSVFSVFVKVIGNGGAGASSGGGSGGGGGGGYAEGIIAVTTNVTVTIGATNSFAGTTTIQATAGSAGSGSGGASGTGSGGTINTSGGNGFPPYSPAGGKGGDTIMGFGGYPGTGSGSGQNGSGYGSGGGGAGTTSGSGGSGQNGAVIVYWAE